jgi:redox-sensitive bicupin YhaK (pirin superfamily)
MTTVIRRPESIHQARGRIQKGTFQGRWHFSFDDYFDPNFMSFGPLRVFNDDTLSPGAVWPLHPHQEIEVVTYCAEGEFRHADERGEGGVLQKGWVQHTTVGRGMWHSEINNRQDVPMRFIQMWFRPTAQNLSPSVEQMKVEASERTNRFLPLVSNAHPGALHIHSQGRVFSCLLQGDHTVSHQMEPGWGAYLYLLEGGPVEVNNKAVYVYGSAIIKDQTGIEIAAGGDSELLMVEVEL